MHFCGKNIVVIRCILLEMHFVVFILVIRSNILKKEKEDGCRLCEIPKGVTNQKRLRNTASEVYGSSAKRGLLKVAPEPN